MSTPPDTFPDEGHDSQVVDGDTLRRDFADDFDFVVVGTGAAGAVAAHALAERGFSVGLVEE